MAAGSRIYEPGAEGVSLSEAEVHAEHVAALEATLFRPVNEPELTFELEGGELRPRPLAMSNDG